MIKVVSVYDPEVVNMIAALDEYQIDLYGLENCHLDSPEELIKQDAYILGAYLNENLVGIGAIKLKESYAEIKRMYFSEEFRGQGMSVELIKKLEDYASKNGHEKILLETGIHQHAALKFYGNQGYKITDAFGEYPDNESSVFMGKTIKPEFKE